MTVELVILCLLAALLMGVAYLVVLMLRKSAGAAEQDAEVQLDLLKAGYLRQLDDRDRQIDELKAEAAQGRQALVALREENATLRTSAAEQARQAELNFQRLMEARQQMTDEFKAIAGDVLKGQGDTFKQQSLEQVGLLLKPLGERLGAFQTGVEKDRATFAEQIRSLAEANAKISAEAVNLTRALKGNAQVQGAWGEMILTSVLERSGLKKGEQFRVQESHTGEEGRRVRTDVEIIFPRGDVLVVDSKVSLTAFEAYVNAGEGPERDDHLRQHVISLRSHIRTLAGKDYSRNANSALDFVILFIPIEPALAAAMTADPALMELALRENVFLATPTTLMSILRTIHNVWQMQNRQKNAEEIAERAGKLYEKVVTFLDDMSKVDANLLRARTAFDNAKQKLSLGQGNVIRQVEMLRDLGAKTSKRISSQWDSSAAGDGTFDDGEAASLFDAAGKEVEPEQDVVPLHPERKTAGGLF